MDAADLNFTYSIVGPPQRVSLGRRATLPPPQHEGLHISLGDGRMHLGGSWLERWIVLGGNEWNGQPRPQHGPVRAWLERHTLVIAGAALVLFVLEALLALAWAL